MGNNASNNKGTDAASGAYSPTPREENIYDQSFPPGPPNSRYGGTTNSSTHPTSSHSSLTHSLTTSSPPVPPRGLERRSHTMVVRERRPVPEAARLTTSSRRLSTGDVTMPTAAQDMNATDNLKEHITENEPRDNDQDVALGTTISVTFDRDIKTVSINKLFEVTCDTVDPSLNPVKGRFNYDARAQKAEFIPLSTLYPNSKYTVVLMGRAVTTCRCSHGPNIKNAEFHFETCDPAPKSIGIKLKSQGQGEKPDVLQIDKYYDLYNSLVIWSTRKWGCSGEHVTGLYTRKPDGRLLPLKADHDVLNLKENDVVLVEIKD